VLILSRREFEQGAPSDERLIDLISRSRAAEIAIELVALCALHRSERKARICRKVPPSLWLFCRLSVCLSVCLSARGEQPEKEPTDMPITT
jgi:hypothetical protein